ncbi:cysteine desulfurase family protein [Eubacteriales bacterium DFI.9.88]|nr:cysteine desulfurase family protein [Eubacteriales bacterium DFI.9.88]
MIYLDNSATTRQHDRVTEVMVQYMGEDFGNPSSLYSLGIMAEKAVKEARKKLARAMDLPEGSLYFTSCGTESDNMAIFGAASARRRRGSRIITTQVEHPAVLEACGRLEQQGFDVIRIRVDQDCRLDLDQLKEAINEETILISVMQVNNETGAIMPIDEIAKMKQNAFLHTDAVQAFGKIPLAKCADLVTVSGHKIHGPKGIGALWIKKDVHIPAFFAGGGQESGMRSGTENVPAIAGLGEAAALLSEEGSVKELRDRLLSGIRDEIKDIRVNSPDDGCPSVLNISFLGTRAEVLLHTLEQDEIYVSTGSACSSNKKGQSHVLKAMGLSDREIEGAIRFSFGKYNTAAEMDQVVDKMKKAVSRFRRLGSFR